MNKIILMFVMFLLIESVFAMPDEWGRGINSDGDVTFSEGDWWDNLLSLFVITGLQPSYQAGQTVTIRTSQWLLSGKSCTGNLYIVMEVYNADKNSQTNSHYCGIDGGCPYKDLSSHYQVASNIQTYSGNWIISFTLPNDILSGTWSISSYLWCDSRTEENADQYSSVDELDFNVVGQAPCTNECSSGQKKCVSAYTYTNRYISTCGNYDSDSCLEYGVYSGDLIDCGGENRCENGECKAMVYDCMYSLGGFCIASPCSSDSINLGQIDCQSSYTCCKIKQGLPGNGRSSRISVLYVYKGSSYNPNFQTIVPKILNSAEIRYKSLTGNNIEFDYELSPFRIYYSYNPDLNTYISEGGYDLIKNIILDLDSHYPEFENIYTNNDGIIIILDGTYGISLVNGFKHPIIINSRQVEDSTVSESNLRYSSDVLVHEILHTNNLVDYYQPYMEKPPLGCENDIMNDIPQDINNYLCSKSRRDFKNDMGKYSISDFLTELTYIENYGIRINPVKQGIQNKAWIQWGTSLIDKPYTLTFSLRDEIGQVVLGIPIRVTFPSGQSSMTTEFGFTMNKAGTYDIKFDVFDENNYIVASSDWKNDFLIVEELLEPGREIITLKTKNTGDYVIKLKLEQDGTIPIGLYNSFSDLKEFELNPQGQAIFYANMDVSQFNGQIPFQMLFRGNYDIDGNLVTIDLFTESLILNFQNGVMI